MGIKNPLVKINTYGRAFRYINDNRKDGLPIEVLVFRSRSEPGMLCELRDWEDTDDSGYPWRVKSPRGQLLTQADDPTGMWYIIPILSFDTPLVALHKGDNTEEWEGLTVASWSHGYHPSEEPKKRRLHKIRSDNKWFLSTLEGMLVATGQAWDPHGKDYIYPLEFPSVDPTDAASQLSKIFLGG